MHKVLTLSNLSYSVSGIDILKMLNLEIPAKSYFAIAGINGAGKSTLIKLILDLIRPASGSEIKIFGQQNRITGCRDQLAYLPEKFDVKKTVSGWQYLQFVTSIYKLTLDKASACNLAEKLDFPVDRLNSKIGSYSKGMVQKLGLISCFMLDRRLLILDEPLSGLDPSARFHFKRLLLEERQNDRTILYSTHLLADAEEICDKFAVLHQGELKYIGTPADCKLRYDADTLEKAYMRCISIPAGSE
ncbi:MAG: ABC transporter ATP-binding protein [Gammaproteobacteria bacterium]|nr:ABC transporter ATP-binding protein [Gammaproteobacteria bacterium]